MLIFIILRFWAKAGDSESVYATFPATCITPNQCFSMEIPRILKIMKMGDFREKCENEQKCDFFCENEHFSPHPAGLPARRGRTPLGRRADARGLRSHARGPSSRSGPPRWRPRGHRLATSGPPVRDFGAGNSRPQVRRFAASGPAVLVPSSGSNCVYSSFHVCMIIAVSLDIVFARFPLKVFPGDGSPRG